MTTSKNSEIKKREEFMLGGTLSELEWEPRSEEQISRDLFKGLDPDKMIDAFEKQKGITIKDVTPRKEIYKCVFLSPCTDDDDQLLLQKFYNNPEQYRVINRSDNWTARGELKIFLEYFENLEARENREQQPTT